MSNPEIVPWRVLSRETALDASPWVRCWRERVEIPSGRVFDDFYTLELPDYAVVFALTDSGDVVMERNYRHGVGEACTVLPAGIIETGEAPEAAARRELLEETGYEAHEWRALGSYCVDSNRGAGHMHAFLARGAQVTAEPRLDAMEQIQVKLLGVQEISDMLYRGEFKTMATAAVAGLALHVLSQPKTIPEVQR